jgi:hypothetical protein
VKQTYVKTSAAWMGVFWLSLALPAMAQTKSSEETKVGASPGAAKAILYVPPPRGAPGSRMGGGTRSARTDACDAQLEALVPEKHVGITTQSQPILQWSLSSKVPCRVDFVLNDSRKPQPVVEKTLEGPFSAGIHQVELSRLGVELEPNVEYEWSVAIVRDPERRSRDTVAGGPVMRHAPLVTAGRSGGELASLYAQEGVWYDALAALSAGIDAHPDDAQLREDRAELLEQVGLGDVAARERGPGSGAR